MINNIVNVFRQQAREHRAIKSFYYHRSCELGSGNDMYPLFWLEDPMKGSNMDNVFCNSVNFAILFVPNEQHSVLELQNLAFSTGLNIIERIKQDANATIGILPDWKYITISNAYDDNACGCRFSINFTQVNMQNLCLIHEQFDPQKELTQGARMTLPIIETFDGKLPEFNLRTSKN